MKTNERCPICGQPYTTETNSYKRKSRHHLFPRRWYKGSRETVFVCQECHNEFHDTFSRARKWSKAECIHYWLIFCEMNGRDPDKIYPKLRKLLDKVFDPLTSG